MPFKGPGIYEIVPFQTPKFSCNSWGGSTNEGEEVKIAERSQPPGQNTLWEVALASGSGADAEYYIINVKNGYFLAATGVTTNITCKHSIPTDPSIRWKLRPATTNGYDVWQVDSLSSYGQLNVRESGQASGTDVISYQISSTDNTKWYFDPVGW
ncbi:Agglutinin [Erysiphe necator]|uniref:Putative agglutinin ssa-like protein n=1 Tax=Uncinula necator TaxID=52586 RepID=A0A0B1P8U0_UNCNE|nr:Agglutinin [Erysiphe necator]KHJ33331.1 putative agglutinin ssa-like protein [Erysiphe necator]